MRVSLGPLLNQDRSTATGLDVLPPADQTRRLPKLYLDRLPSAGVDFTHFTHVRLSLERSGAEPARPITTLFVGTFGAQFLLRRPTNL